MFHLYVDTEGYLSTHKTFKQATEAAYLWGASHGEGSWRQVETGLWKNITPFDNMTIVFYIYHDTWDEK